MLKVEAGKVSRVWKIDDQHSGIVDEHGNQVFTLNDCENGHTPQERDENVVLIVNAPKLLEALISLLHNEVESQAVALNLIKKITGETLTPST